MASGITVALAKPPAGKPPSGGKPPAARDGGDNPYDDSTPPSSPAVADASVSAPANAADAGPVAMLPSAPVGDGGVKPSPLTPAPNEFPPQNAFADGGAPVDYDKLLGDIASLRARVAAVGDTLFHSRIAIKVETDGGHAKIGRLVISLDDGAVFTAKPDFHADDAADVYSHSLAPGRHSITVDVDRKDDRNDAFKTSQRSRFIVDVPRDQELGVEVSISDDSNMGKNFPSDQSGRYELNVRMKASAHPIKK